MFEATITEAVFRLRREGTHWLSTGWNGGHWNSPVAYNISVPEGWGRTDLGAYVASRRQRAGFERDGPALLTGVDLDHLRGARYGPVEAYATVGLSNPAALPIDPTDGGTEQPDHDRPDAGTVNLLVGTVRALETAPLANMLAVAVEAKATVLSVETGFPGTTTDAIVVGCDPDGEPVEYTGSLQEVGAATRACVRDALLASLRSRYPDGGFPATVEDARHGVATTFTSEVFRVG